MTRSPCSCRHHRALPRDQRLRNREDSTLLVHSAAGGVGRLLTQVAHHLGATVIATASTPDKRDIATAAGADYAIGYEDFAAAVHDITGGRGVDVDGVGRAPSMATCARGVGRRQRQFS